MTQAAPTTDLHEEGPRPDSFGADPLSDAQLLSQLTSPPKGRVQTRSPGMKKNLPPKTIQRFRCARKLRSFLARDRNPERYCPLGTFARFDAAALEAKLARLEEAGKLSADRLPDLKAGLLEHIDHVSQNLRGEDRHRLERAGFLTPDSQRELFEKLRDAASSLELQVVESRGLSITRSPLGGAVLLYSRQSEAAGKSSKLFLTRGLLAFLHEGRKADAAHKEFLYAGIVHELFQQMPLDASPWLSRSERALEISDVFADGLSSDMKSLCHMALSPFVKMAGAALALPSMLLAAGYISQNSTSWLLLFIASLPATMLGGTIAIFQPSFFPRTRYSEKKMAYSFDGIPGENAAQGAAARLAAGQALFSQSGKFYSLSTESVEDLELENPDTSLLEDYDQTETVLASRVLKWMLTHPCLSADNILERQELIQWIKDNPHFVHAFENILSIWRNTSFGYDENGLDLGLLKRTWDMWDKGTLSLGPAFESLHALSRATEVLLDCIPEEAQGVLGDLRAAFKASLATLNPAKVKRTWNASRFNLFSHEDFFDIHSESVAKLLAAWAELEACVSVAQKTQDPAWIFPVPLDTDIPFLHIRQGHLPYLYRTQSPEKPSIPNDVFLNLFDEKEEGERSKGMGVSYDVVTGGPNLGKSVLLEMTGNILLGAHAGFPVLGEAAFRPGPIITFVRKRESLSLGEGACYSVLGRLETARLAALEQRGTYILLNEQVAGAIEARSANAVESSYRDAYLAADALVVHVTHNLRVTHLNDNPGVANIHFERTPPYTALPGPATAAHYDLEAIMDDVGIAPEMKAAILEKFEADEVSV